MSVLVTGAAGFIGHHVCARLLDDGFHVIGVDDLNPYYSVALKEARAARLGQRRGFSFHHLDIADHEALGALPEIGELRTIIHVAAQAGVRHSLNEPFAYAKANLVGHLSILELARRIPRLDRMVYASSSSVYGDAAPSPSPESARLDAPVSLYAATKRADELMSDSYASLFGLPQIGLRFFTVYGPWGRPDMAYWLFADRMLRDEPIELFNEGRMLRDFTYIDDVADAVMRVAFEKADLEPGRPHRVYNVGGSRPTSLARFVEILEQALGRRAQTVLLPMQPGEVRQTFADISAISRDFRWAPTTPVEEGLARFATWFLAYAGYADDRIAARA